MIDKNQLFVEKYRPKALNELVLESNTKEMLEKFLQDGGIPHLLLAGNVGCGKTTIAKILLKELDCDSITLNASDERGIDTVRNKIKQFAMMSSFKKWKIVLLDEADAMCLTGDTEIVVGSLNNLSLRRLSGLKNGRKIMIPSVNIETKKVENDIGCLVDSGMVKFYEVELEDGRKIRASSKHPFFTNDFVEVKVCDLKVGDSIIDVSEDFFKKCPDVECHPNVKMKLIKIKSIKKLGIERAYNISMEKNHNFILGNGILTHNTIDAQFVLRNLMETYAGHTRFILTCNYLNKIIEPIRSRCQLIEFNNLQRKRICVILCYIFEKEKIKYDLDEVLLLIDMYYPDIRSMVNTIQLYTFASVWALRNVKSFRNFEQLLNLIKKGDLKNIRELDLDYTESYKYLFDNVDEITENYDKRVALSLEIAEFLYRDTFIADKGINFAACCLKIIEKLKE